MGPFDSRNERTDRSSNTSLEHVPAVCPVCQSSSIITTTKSPNINSYWRCQSCGEIWNVSRRNRTRTGADPWR